MAKIYVETDNIILREMLPEDADGMFELDSDPVVHKYLGNSPVKNIQASRNMIENIRSQYIDRGIGRWAAIEKFSGDFMGWSGLKLNTEQKFNNKIDFYDIGYRFIPRYRGKGYATESAVAAMDYGFNTLNLKTIVGMAEIENIASNRVLQKIGLQYIEDFIFEGVMVSWYELSK